MFNKYKQMCKKVLICAINIKQTIFYQQIHYMSFMVDRKNNQFSKCE